MINSSLPVTRIPEDQRQFRAAVRRFAVERIEPLVVEMDRRAEYCPKLLAGLVEEGLFGIEVPQRHGGLGRGLFDVVLAIIELARADPAVAVLVDVQNALVISALLRWGSTEQQRRFLPRLAAGVVGAYALSEHDAGSDAFAMTTTAQRDGDGFRLTGHKAWITNADRAGVFLTFARTGGNGTAVPRISAFLVDRATAGVTILPPVDKLGLRASSTCEVRFDDVRVDRHDVLGGVGDGTALVVESLNIGKLGIAAQMVGLAQGALDLAWQRAHGRHQFGRRIAEFQGVSFPIARLSAELDAVRVLLYDTTRAVELGEVGAVERMRATAVAKLLAADVAERAASCAVETFGGAGVTPEHRVEKFYRDAKVGRIYEGTANVQLRAIAAASVPDHPEPADRTERPTGG